MLCASLGNTATINLERNFFYLLRFYPTQEISIYNIKYLIHDKKKLHLLWLTHDPLFSKLHL